MCRVHPDVPTNLSFEMLSNFSITIFIFLKMLIRRFIINTDDFLKQNIYLQILMTRTKSSCALVVAIVQVRQIVRDLRIARRPPVAKRQP